MNDKIYTKQTRPDRLLTVKLSEEERAVVDAVMAEKGHSSYAEALRAALTLYVGREFIVPRCER